MLEQTAVANAGALQPATRFPPSWAAATTHVSTRKGILAAVQAKLRPGSNTVPTGHACPDDHTMRPRGGRADWLPSVALAKGR